MTMKVNVRGARFGVMRTVKSKLGITIMYISLNLKYYAFYANFRRMMWVQMNDEYFEKYLCSL